MHADFPLDREEFVGALEGNIPYQPRSALDDLMTI